LLLEEEKSVRKIVKKETPPPGYCPPCCHIYRAFSVHFLELLWFDNIFFNQISNRQIFGEKNIRGSSLYYSSSNRSAYCYFEHFHLDVKINRRKLYEARVGKCGSNTRKIGE
jgi:hypothetical protein